MQNAAGENLYNYNTADINCSAKEECKGKKKKKGWEGAANTRAKPWMNCSEKRKFKKKNK